MVFNAGGSNSTQAMLQRDTNDVTCVTALNGTIVVGGLNQNNHSGGVRQINFLKDNSFAHYTTSTYNGYFKGNIQQRNSPLGVTPQDSGQIVERNVNDIAVTVLPNAPIDPDTGLPVPTIAVATDNGVSVIKDDGTVDSSASTPVQLIKAIDGYWVAACQSNLIVTYIKVGTDLPSGSASSHLNNVWDNWYWIDGSSPSTRPHLYNRAHCMADGYPAFGGKHSDVGLSLLSGLSDKGESVAHITSSYNTGWMNGDIKLATLMDTTAETISAPELVTNGDFSSFGSELVDNGDFSTTSDWTFPNGGGSISNGQATVTATADTNVYIRQDLGSSLVSGKTYAVSFNVVAETGTGLAYVRLGGVDVAPVGSYPQGVETHYITYTGGSPELRFMTYANSGAGFTIDDVSVKEVTGWAIPTTSNSTIDINNGALTGVRNSEDIVSQTLSTPLTAGETYNISFDITYMSSNHWVYFQTNTQHITPAGSSNTTPVGSYSHTFTATSDDTTLFLRAGGTNGLTFTIDNISLTKAVPDRSVNNKGLNIVGNITKEAVATGAELVSYSGNGNNYLTQPHNSDLDVIGDGTQHPYTMMGWFKSKTADSYLSGQGLLLSANVQTDQFISWQFNGADGSVGVWVKNTTGNSQYTPADVVLKNQWNHVVWVNEGGTKFKIYVNGKFVGEVDLSADKFPTSITNREFVFCKSNSNIQTLVKFSLSSPTPEQIAKIYRDEKPLFQEGAKCTLVTNDTVNAIAYDEDTELLHVANCTNTESTRDVFSGLQRVESINHGTNHTNTAISAANGLVVEE
jgi:hypothetical protein